MAASDQTDAVYTVWVGGIIGNFNLAASPRSTRRHQVASATSSAPALRSLDDSLEHSCLPNTPTTASSVSARYMWAATAWPS
jgi:hypothetical protein